MWRCSNCGIINTSSTECNYCKQPMPADAVLGQNVAGRIVAAIACLEVIALILAGLIGMFFGNLPKEDREVAWYVAGAFGILILLIQIAAVGLWLGKKWALPLSLIVFVPSVPSCALPVAVIGLMCLFGGGTWETWRKQREHKAETTSAPQESGQ